MEKEGTAHRRKTKRRLKDRFNEHRRPVDKEINRSTPTTVSEHFLSNNHLATDMQLIPVELISSKSDSVRKTREAYCTGPQMIPTRK